MKAHFSWMLTDTEDIRLKKALGGGAMRDVGCYGLHAVTQMIGFKPVQLSMVGNVNQEYGVDMTSTCVMIDSLNRTAVVTASMELPFSNGYEIMGIKGSIIVDSAFRPDVSDDQRGKVTVRDDNGNIILYETYQDDQYLRQIEHFHDCIFEGRMPDYNVHHSLEMARYLEKSYESFYNKGALTDIS